MVEDKMFVNSSDMPCGHLTDIQEYKTRIDGLAEVWITPGPINKSMQPKRYVTKVLDN